MPEDRDKKPPSETAALPMNEVKPNQWVCFAIPFKIATGEQPDQEALLALTERFGDRICQLIDTEEEWVDVEVAANGKEAATSLTHALQGQLMIARLAAARKARNN